MPGTRPVNLFDGCGFKSLCWREIVCLARPRIFGLADLQLVAVTPSLNNVHYMYTAIPSVYMCMCVFMCVSHPSMSTT